MILVLHQHSHHHHHHQHGRDHDSNQQHIQRRPPIEAESLGSAESNVMPVAAAAAAVQVKKHSNINVRAAFIHVIGDLFQSIGVVVAAYIIRFKVCIVSYLLLPNVLNVH